TVALRRVPARTPARLLRHPSWLHRTAHAARCAAIYRRLGRVLRGRGCARAGAADFASPRRLAELVRLCGRHGGELEHDRSQGRSMKVFYHRGATPNVGDDLNAVLWQRLLPQLEQIHTAQWLIGIGTILDERLASLPGLKVVCGSGLRVNKAIRFGDDVRFAAVRGPLTAQRLGLPAEVVACDPGFLI